MFKKNNTNEKYETILIYIYLFIYFCTIVVYMSACALNALLPIRSPTNSH